MPGEAAGQAFEDECINKSSCISQRNSKVRMQGLAFHDKGREDYAAAESAPHHLFRNDVSKGTLRASLMKGEQTKRHSCHLGLWVGRCLLRFFLTFAVYPELRTLRASEKIDQYSTAVLETRSWNVGRYAFVP